MAAAARLSGSTAVGIDPYSAGAAEQKDNCEKFVPVVGLDWHERIDWEGLFTRVSEAIGLALPYSSPGRPTRGSYRWALPDCRARCKRSPHRSAATARPTSPSRRAASRPMPADDVDGTLAADGSRVPEMLSRR